MTPADEDTNWILTDNDKTAFQGNVEMWLNLVANFGTLEVMSPDDQILNQFQTTITRGTTDPGYRV